MRLITAILLAAVASAAAKDIPPSPTTYVHNEGVLSDAGAAKVSRQLADFEKGTGHQMVVAIFQSLDGANLEDYSNKLFRAWKVGDKKRDDGILFAAFLKDRKWRVEVGYGLEPIMPDAKAYDIATQAAVPYFKRGDFDGGVSSVVSALKNAVLEAEAPADPTPAAAKETSPSDIKPLQPTNPEDELPPGAIVFILLSTGCIALVIVYLVRRSMRQEEARLTRMSKESEEKFNRVYPLPIVTPPVHVHHHEAPPPKREEDPPPRHRSDDDDDSSSSSSGGISFGGGFSGGDSGGGFSGGGFSGGGGSSGGGGASGSW